MMKNPYESIMKNSHGSVILKDLYQTPIRDSSKIFKITADTKLVDSQPFSTAQLILKSEYTIRRLNTNLCLGETYCIITATEIDAEFRKIEYFLLARRIENLHQGVIEEYKKHAPDEYKLSSYLEIAQDEVDVQIKKLLEERAEELDQPDIAWSHNHNLTWTPVPQIGRGFHQQIQKVLELTCSPTLRDCLRRMRTQAADLGRIFGSSL